MEETEDKKESKKGNRVSRKRAREPTNLVKNNNHPMLMIILMGTASV